MSILFCQCDGGFFPFFPPLRMALSRPCVHGEPKFTEGQLLV